MNYYWSATEKPSFYKQVHYVLSHANFEDTLEFVRKNGLEKVKNEFLKPYPGLYSRPAISFAELLLDVKVDKKKYEKVLY